MSTMILFAHDISLRVCLHMYNYVSLVTVNTKFIAFMKRSIIRDPVDERYPHATVTCKCNDDHDDY